MRNAKKITNEHNNSTELLSAMTAESQAIREYSFDREGKSTQPSSETARAIRQSPGFVMNKKRSEAVKQA